MVISHTALRARVLAHPAGQRVRELKAVAGAVRTVLAGRECWPGMDQPFNGQQARLRAVRALIAAFEPDALLETGTFVGSTTRFFCGNGVSVYTAEIKPSFWLLSRLRLGWSSGAEVFLGGSEALLTQLAARRPFERPLAYLDAHWWSDLPVTSELRLLFENWPEAIVVVDDFRVDHDPGYGYDEYDGKALSLDDVEIPDGTTLAFPAVRSDKETGARRGTLYVAWGPTAQRSLASVADGGLLRYAEPC